MPKLDSYGPFKLFEQPFRFVGNVPLVYEFSNQPLDFDPYGFSVEFQCEHFSDVVAKLHALFLAQLQRLQPISPTI